MFSVWSSSEEFDTAATFSSACSILTVNKLRAKPLRPIWRRTEKDGSWKGQVRGSFSSPAMGEEDGQDFRYRFHFVLYLFVCFFLWLRVVCGVLVLYRSSNFKELIET